MINSNKIAVSLAVAAAITAVVPVTAEASTNFDLRKKVIGVSGIMNVVNIDASITRGEFASMLVNASPYRSTVSASSSTSVFADVPRNHEYAPQIRIAAEQGWMTGYLGGNFKPDEYISLQDSVKGLLALLGYTNEDFTGDQTGARLAKYYFLELNDEVNREALELLNREDCINLFYNLLKTDTKSGTFFGKSLGCELTADGEINPLTMVDNSLKGPKVIRSKSRLSDYLPFSLNKANIYLNGQPGNEDDIQDALESDYLLVYYHSGSKTVWAYTIGEEGENQGRYAINGEISNVIYSSVDVMTPSAVMLDGQDTEYELTSSDMQFAFSMYGDLRVGDSVTLVYQITADQEGNETRTVIDYIED